MIVENAVFKEIIHYQKLPKPEADIRIFKVSNFF